jgi:hypothetical protein
MDGAHNTEEVLTSNDFMVAPTLPAPWTAEKFTEAIHDTVVNG